MGERANFKQPIQIHCLIYLRNRTPMVAKKYHRAQEGIILLDELLE